MEHTIFGLIKKRGEIAGQHKVAVKAADVLKADLDAIDRALAAMRTIPRTSRRVASTSSYSGAMS